MDHRCRERDRIDELRSGIGQAAYSYYSEWMKQKKRSVPPIETFSASRYYTTFIKFAEFAAKTNIPNIPQFIKMMVTQNDISPSLWCRDNVYSMYLQWYDQAFPPEVQVLESLDYLKLLAEDYEVELNKVFTVMPNELLVQLIKRRKLSPWFLMSSKVFRDFLKTQTDLHKERLESALGLGAMIGRIQKDQGLFEFFNRVTQAEGL